MQYLEYREQRSHGSFGFPFAYYNICENHPRYQMTLHWHAEVELVRVNVGRLALALDGRLYEGRAGDVFWVPGGTLHGATPHHCRYDCLVFDLASVIQGHAICKQALEPLLQGEQLLPCHYSGGHPALHALLDAFAGGPFPGQPLAAIGGLYQFLADVAFPLDGVQTGGALLPVSGGHRLEALRAALSRIKTSYAEELNLSDLAACAHMNEHYFCRYFKKMTQKTPIAYLNYYRVECACERLQNTEKSITEVAMECGFSSISYFVRVFRQWKGMPPGRYRRQQR